MSIFNYKTKIGAIIGWVREFFGDLLVYLLFVALFFGAAFLVVFILQLFLSFSSDTGWAVVGISTFVFALGYGIYHFKLSIDSLKSTLQLFDKIKEIKKIYGENVFDSKDNDDDYKPETYQPPQQNSQSQNQSFGCPRYTEFTCGIQYRM